MDSSCPDLNPAVRCNDHCMDIYTHCHFECERETACEFECYADLDVCLRACPCFDDCPAGIDNTLHRKNDNYIFIGCLYFTYTQHTVDLRSFYPTPQVSTFISGCDGCDSAFCVCIEPESDSNFVDCQKAAETEYHQCAFDCPVDDIHCISNCSRKYHEKFEKCPCQVSLKVQFVSLLCSQNAQEVAPAQNTSALRKQQVTYQQLLL